MPPTTEELQKQADLLQRQIAAQQEADKALKKAKETPRAPELVITDLFDLIAMRLGNRPEMKLLIAEFKAATKQPEPEPSTATT